jgi:hypothetical protein
MTTTVRVMMMSTTKISRQEVYCTSRPPKTGARMGETLSASMASESSRAASGPVYSSRMTAMGITAVAAAPSPWKKREAISTPMLGAKAAPTEAMAKIPRPTKVGPLRPSVSDTGP